MVVLQKFLLLPNNWILGKHYALHLNTQFEVDDLNMWIWMVHPHLQDVHWHTIRQLWVKCSPVLRTTHVILVLRMFTTS